MLKKTLKTIAIIVILINMFILFSGRLYLYKAIKNNLADIDNWEVFANRPISNDTITEIPASSSYNKNELNQACLDRLKKYKSVAFLALKDDSIIYERYWDGYSDSSHSSSFSMAKSIVSVLVGIAVDEGKIKSIDEPVGNYLSEFKVGKKSQITIRHVLEMSSGISWDESYINPLSVTTEAYYCNDLRGMYEKLEVAIAPGQTFDYASCNQIILQQLLKKVTGKNIADYMSEKLWKPLHAKHAASWSLDKKDGNEKAYCCVNSNIRDFSRIGSLFLHKGQMYGHQIISEAYVNESIKPAAIKDEDGNPCNFYGLSWWLGSIDYKGQQHEVYYMRGILGQYVMVCPDYNLIVCRLGHMRDDDKLSADKHHRVDIFEYMHAVLEAYVK
ncbi:MAG: serine hydrolase [Bacteroidetes bacterium]|nr:serine hydrolase [Bacteroidota bacterium]